MCVRCGMNPKTQLEHWDGLVVCMCRACNFPLRMHCVQCGHDSDAFIPRKILPGQWVREGQKEGWVTAR
jgi:hypothetical protein